MLKKTFKLFLIVALFALSIFTVYAAFNIDDPGSVINVTKNGASDHGNVTMEYNTEIDPSLGCESGVFARVVLSADAGYYVSNLEVEYDGQDLPMGFIAASSHGTFLREYVFSPHEDTYEFCIPNEASTAKKVNVTATFAEKAPVYVYYNVGNSGGLIVEDYQEGDIILPEACTNNGCTLKIVFDSEADYETYEQTKMSSNPQENDPWFNADAGDGALTGSVSNCVKGPDSYYCTAEVKENFKDQKLGFMDIGYTRLKVYAPGYLGFNIITDVPNFNDLLDETGGSQIDFSDSNTTRDIQLFYGTRQLVISAVTPAPIVQQGTELDMGSFVSFDDITGSGYGYNVVKLTPTTWAVNIDSYYQDEMALKLNIKDGENNVFDNGVTINLHRIAFAGNAGELLEVDSEGKNCKEPSLNPHCEDGIYYSTQYRGVMGFKYVANGATPVAVDNVARVIDVSNNTITLADDSSYADAYARDKEFNPHAIALFYDGNEEIVKVEDFDLNELVLKEGIVSVENFNKLLEKDKFFDGYSLDGYSLSGKDYVNTDRTMVPIASDDYFFRDLNDVIMHDLVLISKDEAKELGIRKIGLFLVNGEIEKGSIPELTYGIGEGRIMQVRDGD